MAAMLRNRPVRALVVLGILASITLVAGDGLAKGKKQAKRRPSTAAERASAAKAARELELDPLGPDAEARRKVAGVVLDAPDIQVPLCVNVLGSFPNETAPRHGLLLQQMLFSTMAFMLEHPERASDLQESFLAGILGTLKAYSTMRDVEPASRSPFLDRMLDLQKRGELEAYYRKETAPCVAAAP